MTLSFTSRLRTQLTQPASIILAACLVLGTFLSLSNFSESLHFELDQSYDTLVVNQALENGPSSLPLLGPSIGTGQALRLPPAYYYLEYVSALVFGNTPAGHAMAVPLLYLASIVIAFIFFRRFFALPIGLMLTFLWTISAYIVIYARFSWNPNILPFCLITLLYTLFRSIDPAEPKRGRWFLLFAALFAFTTQLHVNTFFVLPPVLFIFFLFTRPRFPWKIWLGGFIILAIAYSPLLINDLRGGGNAAVFQERFYDGIKNLNAFPKLIQTFQYTASNYLLILSGHDHINGKKLTGFGFNSPAHYWWRLGALITFGSLVLLLGYRTWREPAGERKKLFLFISLWFLISTLYFFALRLDSFNIYPRFFLAVLPIPFILLAIGFEEAWQAGKVGLVLILMIFIPLIAGNTQTLVTYFDQLSRVASEPLRVETEDIFPNTARVTLAQQIAITDHIEMRQKENGYPVYLNAGHEFTPVLWYHLERRGISFHEDISKRRLYQEGNYFFIPFAIDEISDKLERFDIQSINDFGSLVVYTVTPKPESITAFRQDTNTIKPSLQTLQVSQFLTWKEFFAQKDTEREDSEAEKIIDAEQAEEKENQLTPEIPEEI